jgi:thymidylate synthase (FAD)
MIEVTYVNHMGDDLSVVNAARVSFGKKSDYMMRIHNGEAKVLQHKDSRLIRYLAKHKHKSPFNHTFTTFHVKAPVFVARQLVKHEYMPWNEISRRYVDNYPQYYVPDVWRGRSEDKKQGSSDKRITKLKQYNLDSSHLPDDKSYYGDIIEKHVPINEEVRTVVNKLDSLYHELLDSGVAPEQARMVLPQSMMTEWYWSGTLYAFAKMCGLRLKEDTQAETRIVAEKIEDVMAELYPVSWEALRMYEE